MPVVGMTEALHGQDVGMHVGRHTLGILHYTSPIQFGGPSGLASEASTTWTGICINSGTIVVPQTVPRGTVLAYLSHGLTHPRGPPVSVACHEAAALFTVNVVTAALTIDWPEHESLRQSEAHGHHHEGSTQPLGGVHAGGGAARLVGSAA